jgi:MFS family permease
MLLSEVTPYKWKSVMIAGSQSLFTLGEITSAFMIMADDMQMHGLHWRQLLILGIAPSLLFWIASCVILNRSPFFLAQQGEYDEAREVLTIMQRDNAVPEGSVDFRVELPTVQSQTLLEQMKVMYNSPLFPSTIILIYTGFVINFTYYGCLYAFANLLPSLGNSMGPPSLELFVGALWEIPGIVFGCLAFIFMPRKTVLNIYLMAICSSALLFLLGTLGDSASGNHALLHVLCRLGYYCLKCSSSFGCVILYIYISELLPASIPTRGTLLPASIRTAGTSIGFASGRVAAMVAPLLFEKLRSDTGSYCMFFVIIIIMAAINLVFIDLLPFETFGTELWRALSKPVSASPSACSASSTPRASSRTDWACTPKLVEKSLQVKTENRERSGEHFSKALSFIEGCCSTSVEESMVHLSR